MLTVTSCTKERSSLVRIFNVRPSRLRHPPHHINLLQSILYNLATQVQMLSRVFDGFLDRFSFIFRAGARPISLQNIDTQPSPMTISPVASPETRPTALPILPSPLPFHTAVASQPAPVSPLANKAQEEGSTSPLSEIEYIPNGEQEKLPDDDQEELPNAANDAPGKSSNTANDDTKEASNSPKYRSPKILPFELYQHCLVYLEEQLCKETHFRRFPANLP
jgi:hypothetical protein